MLFLYQQISGRFQRPLKTLYYHSYFFSYNVIIKKESFEMDWTYSCSTTLSLRLGPFSWLEPLVLSLAPLYHLCMLPLQNFRLAHVLQVFLYDIFSRLFLHV